MKKTALLLLLIVFFTNIQAYKKSYLSQKQLNKISSKYGQKALTRVKAWNDMMQSIQDKKILQKLKKVNDFFNKIRYKTDSKHWRKKDYWATPFEFMGTGAGDCEDYAIAKYFSLRKLGVKENKLRITYVTYKRRGTKYDQAHMVLTYFHKPNSTPIVLDNINKKLKLATKRKDLKPIYSFNAGGLWQAKNRGKTQKKVGKNNLKNWKSLMSRI